MRSRLAPILLLCASCTGTPGTGAGDSAPKIRSCAIAVGQGTVRFAIQYAHSRPPSDRILVIASVRRAGGEDVLRALVRRSERSIVVSASGRELIAAEGWAFAPAVQGGSIEFAIPEGVPGEYDLSGVKGRAHVVVQVERGEGAIGLGEVDSGEMVF